MRERGGRTLKGLFEGVGVGLTASSADDAFKLFARLVLFGEDLADLLHGHLVIVTQQIQEHAARRSPPGTVLSKSSKRSTN